MKLMHLLYTHSLYARFSLLFCSRLLSNALSPLSVAYLSQQLASKLLCSISKRRFSLSKRPLCVCVCLSVCWSVSVSPIPPAASFLLRPTAPFSLFFLDEMKMLRSRFSDLSISPSQTPYTLFPSQKLSHCGIYLSGNSLALSLSYRLNQEPAYILAKRVRSFPLNRFFNHRNWNISFVQQSLIPRTTWRVNTITSAIRK